MGEKPISPRLERIERLFKVLRREIETGVLSGQVDANLWCTSRIHGSPHGTVEFIARMAPLPARTEGQ